MYPWDNVIIFFWFLPTLFIIFLIVSYGARGLRKLDKAVWHIVALLALALLHIFNSLEGIMLLNLQGVTHRPKSGTAFVRKASQSQKVHAGQTLFKANLTPALAAKPSWVKSSSNRLAFTLAAIGNCFRWNSLDSQKKIPQLLILFASAHLLHSLSYASSSRNFQYPDLLLPTRSRRPAAFRTEIYFLIMRGERFNNLPASFAEMVGFVLIDNRFTLMTLQRHQYIMQHKVYERTGLSGLRACGNSLIICLLVGKYHVLHGQVLEQGMKLAQQQ